MRRVNCYYDIQADPDRTRVAIHGRPGLTLFDNLGETKIRGIWALGAALYVVHRSTLYKVIADGTHSVLGTLDTSTGHVFFSDNGTQVMLVDGTSGYTYNTSTSTFAKITDVDFPANPLTVTYMNGYFIVNPADAETFYISSLSDGAAWDALDFDSAFVEPDKLLAVFAYGGVLGLFGEISTEYWGYTGAPDFPFGRVLGANYGWGIAAPASIAKFGSEVIGLLRNVLGESMVGIISGGEPIPVSDSDLVSEFNSYSELDDAVGFSYLLNGHMMYQLSFPTAKKTWVYDRNSNIWSEYHAFGKTQHRGEIGVQFNGALRVGDFENGKIYTVSDSVLTDAGDPIEIELISRGIHDDNTFFFINSFQLDMEEGVGLQTGQGSDPQAMLSVSRDKGRTFGNEIWAGFGKVGKYNTRAVWRRLGRARQANFKVRITDPVKVVITGEKIDMQKGIA